MRRLRLVQPRPTSPLPGEVSEEPAPAPGSPPTALVQFLVDVPADTPADANIWLAGNQPALGDWRAAGLQLERRENGRYAGHARFPLDSHLELKVTRGSWETVEKGPSGEEVDNWSYEVSGPALLELQVAAWGDRTGWHRAGGSSLSEQLTGLIRYHEVPGAPYGLEPRRLIVYLPPDYEQQPQRRYPVLYMNDGQNLMNARTAAFGVEWGVDEVAQQLILSGQIEPLIIIGIYNTKDRLREYTQVHFNPLGGGHADDYGRLLAEGIKPLIDATYRTRPEASCTGLAGSSLGGLVSLYLGLQRSDLFGRLGVLSPTVFWAERDIVARVERLKAKLPLRIWLDMGTRERPGAAACWRLVEEVRALRDALLGRGWLLDEDLRYLEAVGARHEEAAWGARFDQVLRFLYPPLP